MSAPHDNFGAQTSIFAKFRHFAPTEQSALHFAWFGACGRLDRVKIALISMARGLLILRRCGFGAVGK
jgi:hypothetical protein